jgi:UDP-N-acetylglucosamine acyltransferase
MLRGVNTIGLQRAGFGAEDIADVKKAYRSLFGNLGSIKERVAELPQELAEKPHISVLLTFINETQRGICSPSKSITGRD